MIFFNSKVIPFSLFSPFSLSLSIPWFTFQLEADFKANYVIVYIILAEFYSICLFAKTEYPVKLLCRFCICEFLFESLICEHFEWNQVPMEWNGTEYGIEFVVKRNNTTIRFSWNVYGIDHIVCIWNCDFDTERVKRPIGIGSEKNALPPLRAHVSAIDFAERLW